MQSLWETKQQFITLFVFSRSNSTDLILSRESISNLSFSTGISTGLFLISSYFFSSLWIRSKQGPILSFIVVSVGVGVRVHLLSSSLGLERVMVYASFSKAQTGYNGKLLLVSAKTRVSFWLGSQVLCCQVFPLNWDRVRAFDNGIAFPGLFG